MNCTHLDDALADANRFVVRDDVGFGVGCGALLLLSLALLVAGERFARPLAAGVGGVAGAVVAFALTRQMDECLARLAVAGGAGVVCALVALCLFRAGVFAVGAAACGTLGHFVYEAVPLDRAAPPFVFLGRSAYYYAVVGGAALVGAVVSQCQRRDFLRLASAMLGGGGLATASHLVVDRAGGALPAVALLTIALGAATVGVLVQARLARRRKARRRAPAEGGA
jgi:hypothetical protein